MNDQSGDNRLPSKKSLKPIRYGRLFSLECIVVVDSMSKETRRVFEGSDHD